MRIERLLEFARAVPFEPFRMFPSNGSSWLVPHPDFVFFCSAAQPTLRRPDVFPPSTYLH